MNSSMNGAANPTEVDIDGTKYRIGHMNVFDQGHVASRVLPIVAGVTKAYVDATAKLAQKGLNPEALSKGPNGEGEGEAEGEAKPEELDTTIQRNDIVFAAMEPIAKFISEMSDSDREYVWKKCLSVVMKQNPQGGWAPIMRNGMFMFEAEMTLTLLMRLTMEVIQDNLGPTLSGLLGQTMGVAASPSQSSSLI